MIFVFEVPGKPPSNHSDTDVIEKEFISLRQGYVIPGDSCFLLFEFGGD